jgi:hypothetical protein
MLQTPGGNPVKTLCFESIECVIDVENKLIKIWKPCGLGYACTTNEQHFPARMSQHEPLRNSGEPRT